MWTGLALAALAAGAPVAARKPAPPPPPPAPVIPQVHSGDAAVDAYYFYDRQGTPLWLASAGGRAAAARIVEILKRAPIDGLAEGPALASIVEAAITSGTLEDDAKISAAWVKYAKAINAPVGGVEYGDPALMLKAPTAKDALSQVARAPSMAVEVDRIANVNSFYSALRSAALNSGSATDPHVRATLDRLRLVPNEGKVIIVDTASQRLLMVENGVVSDTMKVVVGKVKSPTYDIAGTVNYVTLNPYWNIPTDVVQRRGAPVVLKRGVSYLKAARYETTDKWGSTATAIDPTSVDWKAVAAGEAKAYMRQLPGIHNMMGKMKFGFANRYDIFLHDTPHKELFAKASRNLSMGCVRLEAANRLAVWLLGHEPDLTSDAPEQQVALDKAVPVYTIALTASVGPEGDTIDYAEDVYGFDSPSQAQAAAAATPVADDGT